MRGVFVEYIKEKMKELILMLLYLSSWGIRAEGHVLPPQLERKLQQIKTTSRLSEAGAPGGCSD